MEMSEFSLKEMTLGERMVRAAKLAVEMHLGQSGNGMTKTSRTTTAATNRIGGAGLSEVTEDLRRARTESSTGAREPQSSRAPRVFYDYAAAQTSREGAD